MNIRKEKNMEFIVKGKQYIVISKLGQRKGGYSFLVECEGRQFVLKKYHDEIDSHNKLSNRIQSEHEAYMFLSSLNLPIPKMYDIDFQQEIIIKEYIEGDSIYDLVLHDKMKKDYIDQMKEICKVLYANNINIDYFPTNFVVRNDVIFYIDYDCNKYVDEWNFENWGIKYWSKTPEFNQYVKQNSR